MQKHKEVPILNVLDLTIVLWKCDEFLKLLSRTHLADDQVDELVSAAQVIWNMSRDDAKHFIDYSIYHDLEYEVTVIRDKILSTIFSSEKAGHC